jgi:hypothetical protein
MKYSVLGIKYVDQQDKKFVRVIATTVFLAFLTSALIPLAAYSASISESYPGSGDYPLGSLVSIKQTEPISIELANLGNNNYLTGVAVAEEDSLLNINRPGGNIHVATSGDVEVFVSEINGSIATGDFIGASWISGVAMRANEGSEQKLLGVALQGFSKDSENQVLITDVDIPTGTRNAIAGKIIVRLFDRDIGTDTSLEQSGIESLAQRIAGKDVAYIRVLVAAGLFLLSAIISGVFLANAIRGSFISLGRNPLASSSIFASLMQVSGVSIGLVIIGAFMAYLVLIL